MKSVTTYFLLLAFSTSLLVNLVVLADFVVRTDYYANVLCENKDKPERKCNGKCQLAKTTENENIDDFTFPKLIDFSFDCVEAKAEKTLQKPLFFVTRTATFYVLTIPINDFSFGFFHPPKFKIVA